MKILVADAMVKERLDSLRGMVNGVVQWTSIDGDEGKLLQEVVDTDVFVGIPFTAEMAQAAEKLRLVQLAGAGTGGVAFEALPEGVKVANTYHHERSIAEYVLMSMLALSRHLRVADKSLRQGVWYSVRHDSDIPLPHTLEARTVGIIGFGHIGRQVARLANCLSMEVMAIKRTPDAALTREYRLAFLGAAAELPRLLQKADFLVVAAPLTEETRGLLDAQALDLMKPTAYVINVARGPIVDERALYRALVENRIAGAAIDTWYQYPGSDGQALPATQPFHTLDNVIMTPHTSGETEETVSARLRDVAQNINRLLEGQPLRNVVHP
jgi:phosphoglycerate dehydrogenase-like enzyme